MRLLVVRFKSVTADACDAQSTIVYADFRKELSPMAKFKVLTDEERQTGVITRKIPTDAVNFKVYFQNSYGIWTHPMTRT